MVREATNMATTASTKNGVGQQLVPTLGGKKRPARFLHRAMETARRARHGLQPRQRMPTMSAEKVSEISNTTQALNYAAHGHAHNMDKKQIARAIISHAYAVMLTQNLLTELSYEEAKADPPTWIGASPIFDGTKMKLRFYRNRKPPTKGTNNKKSKHLPKPKSMPSKLSQNLTVSMEIFVHKLVIAWGWDDERKPLFIEFTIPPIPVTTTGAAHTIGALENHVFTRPIHKFFLDMTRLVHENQGLPMRLGTKDDASGNDLACAVIVSAPLTAHVVTDFTNCLNHQENITEVDVTIAVYGPSFLKGVNDTTSFLNIGTHRLRLLMVAHSVITDMADFVIGEPDPLDVRYAHQLCDLLCHWADISARTRYRRKDPTGAKSKPSGAQHARSVLTKEYFKLVTGGYSTDRIKVHTAMELSPTEKRAHIQKIVDNVEECQLSPLFPTPRLQNG